MTSNEDAVREVKLMRKERERDRLQRQTELLKKEMQG